MIFYWIFNSIKVAKENTKRLERLKDLGSQMEYSYTKINDFDKDMKKVTTSISQHFSDMGDISKKMGDKLK